MAQVAVSDQPRSEKVELMPLPAPISGCPPGMEYLAQLDQVLIKQEVHMLEVLTGFECKNKFRILNSLGQQAYFAAEESGLAMRLCCGPERGFVFHVLDNAQQEVFRVRRDFKCCKGCFCCPCDKACRYYAVVEDRNGQLLGYVSNLRFCCVPLFGLFEADGSLLAKIKGPCCPCQAVCCTDDLEFVVTEEGGRGEMGKLTKMWPGFLKDTFTKADNFRVSFPLNQDVRKKALLIAAVFVVDIMLYEENDN